MRDGVGVTDFALVRHGQTDWNAQRRIQGSTDVPLNDVGRQQAVAAASALSGYGPAAVVASPLSRATETAQIISDRLRLGRILVVPELIERSYGEIEGLTREERMQRFPDGLSVPHLETRQSVVDRALPALLGLVEQWEGERIIVVTHGGVIGSVIRSITSGEFPLPGDLIANGSQNHISFAVERGTWKLERYSGTVGDPGYAPVP